MREEEGRHHQKERGRLRKVQRHDLLKNAQKCVWGGEIVEQDWIHVVVVLIFKTLGFFFFLLPVKLQSCSCSLLLLHHRSLNRSLVLVVVDLVFFFFSTYPTPGGESVLLSSGIHSFPFKLGLPLGLPSTFLGKHGWVRKHHQFFLSLLFIVWLL